MPLANLCGNEEHLQIGVTYVKEGGKCHVSEEVEEILLAQRCCHMVNEILVSSC